MVNEAPLVLILVQNLPLPGDRRVWLECKSLRDNGYRVAAITPAAPGDPAYELHEGVHLYKYRPPKETSSIASFLWEFVYCWIRTFFLTMKVTRQRGVPAVIQSCNPPDTFWLIGLIMRIRGSIFVFDQHDLNPEVYESRFNKRGGFYTGLKLLERATYKTAKETIVTNESYAEVARTRGKVPAERVTVVRTGPDTTVLKPGEADLAARRGRSHLVHFHGVMGPQDGVDIVIRMIDYIVHEKRRDDISFSVLGKGDEYTNLRALVTELGLDDYVYMPGRVSDEELFRYLSSADIGLSADPPNPLNDVSTMNKTMEYMAFGLPVIAFDLKETRFSAGEAAIYVTPATPVAYGNALLALLDEPEQMAQMSRAGRERAENVLDWRFQSVSYLSVFDRLTNR
ncbi:glycosyltransferase family 4 protein [Herbiconiux sp. KACC 21604]|uniref:glycosyltransferase family 4 protein n=1 Tax=unclassified Herbiconiux TaxID=2618217 RepID=UPI0014930AC9|nr:glycosyltransferase family 4 protein [Herbiconiux sp. SALV-R1]QJU54571.1 glycosyltransferase family 4 protein [Herbiconiux sp. SALV-R1]WPO85657.1 glycosyltransferase family 4 protein [Herbiconiux sp. KACC 21604]